MAPLNNDIGSKSALVSSKSGERMGQMNSIQRISAQSLMMVQPRGKHPREKPVRSLSLRDLLREHSQTSPSIPSPLSPTEKKQEPLTILVEHETESLSLDPTARRKATDVMIPMEITVIDDSGVHDDSRAIGADIMNVEALSKDLKKSRKKVDELMMHNKAILDKLRKIIKKNEATVDAQALLKQEITLLKACLFLSMIFVMCGGRAEFIALIVFGWAFADVFV
jgi:hypothetical protein